MTMNILGFLTFVKVSFGAFSSIFLGFTKGFIVPAIEKHYDGLLKQASNECLIQRCDGFSDQPHWVACQTIFIGKNIF